MLNVSDSVMRSTVKLWAQVIEFEYPTDVLLSKFFRENRKLGMKNRSIIAETIYTILRNFYRLSKVVDPKNSFTLVAYTWLHLLSVGRHEIRELKSISLGEVDKLSALDLMTIELPAWVIKHLEENMSHDEIYELSETMRKTAPLTLRVNTLKASRDEVLNMLEASGIKAKPTQYSPYGIKLNNKTALMNNQLFLDGLVEVQDEASQLAGLIFEPKRGEMIADFCAGGGGKTLLISMLMKNTGRVYAFDINERRLNNLTPRLSRAGLSNIYPQLITNENDLKVKRLAGKMDRVFVDAPCLGFGTLRRNPDLKFRQGEAALIEINVKQIAILDTASRLVKPGGKLLYATCSILNEENHAVVDGFIAKNPEFEVVDLNKIAMGFGLELKDPGYLELWPHSHDTDGFFACVMQRKLN